MKKLSTLHFQNKILTQQWHGTGARCRPLIAGILQRLRAERPDEDVFGEPLPKLQILGDVAVIPIVGTLMINVPDWAKELGLSITDANDIAEELDRAVNDPAVKFIVLDFDSPGGWSVAGDKLFDLVESADRRRPVFSFCADGNDCCSSAYEAAAASRVVLCGKQALAVGCIGSYLAILDDTKFWDMLGLKWEVLRSGDLKGIGEDGISDEQRAWLQGQVDACGDTFRRNVKKYRTQIPDAEMRGQYYTGVQAAHLGFCAGTAKDLAAAIARFRDLI